MQMRSRLKDLLKTLEGDWFKGKLTRHGHFEAIARIDNALNQVPKDFDVEDRRRFMASCFGHFMSMHLELKFSGGVIHQLLLRELDHNGTSNEMRFLLGNHVVRFSNVEFYLITGLRFGVVPDTNLFLGGVRCCEVVPHLHVELDIDGGGREIKDSSLAVSVGGGPQFLRRVPVGCPRLYERRDDVIPQLGIDFGARRVTEFSPRMLKWELTKQRRGKKQAKIFSARTSSAEGPDKEDEVRRHSETEASDPSGSGFSVMDTEGSEPSSRRAPWEHQFNELREALRKSEDD
ncbi:hypothetical protein Ddye_019858 [Dipteronia dyeriana]|uniref:Uncharacterized protein n=1 Tax=Dipteronia dyeriana TaxID=168575 RepID=A0AAD9TZJ1_9ROSI|nr:hypothetical protein Ddye_019858 [Dipteronia dyeriana]